jgi:hypothetical protein
LPVGNPDSVTGSDPGIVGRPFTVETNFTPPHRTGYGSGRDGGIGFPQNPVKPAAVIVGPDSFFFHYLQLY